MICLEVPYHVAMIFIDDQTHYNYSITIGSLSGRYVVTYIQHVISKIPDTVVVCDCSRLARKTAIMLHD